MSIDFFFHTCNISTRKIRVKNRFTGKTATTFDDDGMSTDERASVAKLLKSLKAKGPDEFGFYVLALKDGGEAEVSANGLIGDDKFDGCSVYVRGVSSKLIEFLFRLCRDGNLVVTPAIAGVDALVTSLQQQEKVKPRFPNAKVVETPIEMAKMLQQGLESAQQHRDQVTEE